jgi:methionine aminopeptidase
MSTGEGKPRAGDARTTVFKTNVENKYQLKMKASRSFFSEVNKKYQTFPFSLRNFDDERSARMGVKEPLEHELITPYPVFFERNGAKVAHFKCTVLVLPGGGSIVTGLPLPEYFNSAKACDEESAAILIALDEAKAKKDKKKAAKKNKAKAKK